MSTEDVTYACGHDGTLVFMPGTRRNTRDFSVRRARERRCPDCVRAQRLEEYEARRDAAVEASAALPPIATGTERQRAWATTLRHEWMRSAGDSWGQEFAALAAEIVDSRAWIDSRAHSMTGMVVAHALDRGLEEIVAQGIWTHAIIAASVRPSGAAHLPGLVDHDIRQLSESAKAGDEGAAALWAACMLEPTLAFASTRLSERIPGATLSAETLNELEIGARRNSKAGEEARVARIAREQRQAARTAQRARLLAMVDSAVAVSDDRPGDDYWTRRRRKLALSLLAEGDIDAPTIHRALAIICSVRWKDSVKSLERAGLRAIVAAALDHATLAKLLGEKGASTVSDRAAERLAHLATLR